MKNHSIKPFTIDLYENVLELWQQCDGVGLSSADEKGSIASYLDRNPGMSFVAESDGKIVGAVLAGHDGRRGYLHHLAVHPDYRHRGIGSQLVGKCLGILAQAGMQKCHLFIFNDNETGKAFWESQGWELRKDISVISKSIGK